jgi:hypothetical protein
MNLLGALLSAFRTRGELALENLVLRQQLASLRRTSSRPRMLRHGRPRPWARSISPMVALGGRTSRRQARHRRPLNKRHLRRILTAYFAYYHRSRTHLSLGKDAPEPEAVHATSMGRDRGATRSGRPALPLRAPRGLIATSVRHADVDIDIDRRPSARTTIPPPLLRRSCA